MQNAFCMDFCWPETLSSRILYLPQHRLEAGGTGPSLTYGAKLGAVSDLVRNGLGAYPRSSAMFVWLSLTFQSRVGIASHRQLASHGIYRRLLAGDCSRLTPLPLPRLYIPYTSYPPRFPCLPPSRRGRPDSTLSATLPYLLPCDIPQPWYTARPSQTRIPAILQ